MIDLVCRICWRILSSFSLSCLMRCSSAASACSWWSCSSCTHLSLCAYTPHRTCQHKQECNEEHIMQFYYHHSGSGWFQYETGFRQTYHVWYCWPMWFSNQQTVPMTTVKECWCLKIRIIWASEIHSLKQIHTVTWTSPDGMTKDQLDYMQTICTLLQIDNNTNTS